MYVSKHQSFYSWGKTSLNKLIFNPLIQYHWKQDKFTFIFLSVTQQKRTSKMLKCYTNLMSFSIH